MKTLIIEDEQPAARRLKRLLSQLQISVDHMLHSVEGAVIWFKDNPAPDLIFLDIQLSDGLSFKIFEEVEVKSAIIFTTAYDEYALRAFKLNSIDYLLKPIDDQELAAAVQKYKNTKSSPQVDLQTLRSILKAEPFGSKVYRKRFMIKVGNHLKIILTDEIVCFCSQDKGTYLRSTDEKNYLLDSSLESLETELNPEVFFRVNRQYIISIGALKDVIRYSNSRYKIEIDHFDEEMIIVSRERSKAFKAWLSR